MISSSFHLASSPSPLSAKQPSCPVAALLHTRDAHSLSECVCRQAWGVWPELKLGQRGAAPLDTH
ncbi:hypothetical protein CCMA1212_004835 [Trichoderma ghanense]|uniref:Uncharacterized protein n=1 Tax=Trichoderma ghanense TaxID=65468 RepID=A0ABY2H624_9HYPO